MKRILLSLLIIMTIVGYTSASYSDSLQGYDITSGSTGGVITTGNTLTSGLITADTSTGIVEYGTLHGDSATAYIYSNPTTSFSYAAFDVDVMYRPDGDHSTITVALYDSAWNQISSISNMPFSTDRYEMKIIGGTPTLFVGGTQCGIGSIVSVNPSYISVVSGSHGVSPYFNEMNIDNVLLGGTDHHVIGSIPTNWSIQRDLIDPSNIGVYAVNIGGSNTWDLKNSYVFAVDADVDSTDSATTENLQITNVDTGVIVNTTVIDSTIPRHRITYDLTQFLSNDNVVDGQYSIGYNGSTVLEYLWVISTGASINFDRSTYTAGSTATLTYAISTGYYTPTTYTYSYKIIDVYGNEKTSGTLSTQSGTFTISTTGYSQGVYYVELVATTISDSSVNILAWSGTTITNYITFFGAVNNGQNQTLISGAVVNITQSGTATTNVVTTGSNGNYSFTGYLTGSRISVVATASGFSSYSYTFTPMVAKSIDLNITLDPNPPILSGIGVAGTARDSTYGIPIAGAAILVANVSTGESYLKYTNNAGWYLCDNGASCSLVSQRLYNVSGSATGYLNSLVYQVVMP